jgi:hypothetical protein
MTFYYACVKSGGFFVVFFGGDISGDEKPAQNTIIHLWLWIKY